MIMRMVALSLVDSVIFNNKNYHRRQSTLFYFTVYGTVRTVIRLLF